MTRVTLQQLATLPRWPVDVIDQIPGRVRGNALRAWGAHVARIWGPEAPGIVRQRLGVDASTLPDKPTKKDWLPVSIQVRLPHVIVDEWLDGDIMAFESVFSETSSTTDKVMFYLASKIGPTAVLKQAGRYHARVCDVGVATASAKRGAATIEFKDAVVFGNPTWRIMQILGMRTMFAFLKRELGECYGHDTGKDSFTLELRW